MTALQDMNDRYAVYRQVIGDQGAMAIPGESFGAQNGGSLLRGAAHQIGYPLLKRGGVHMLGIGSQ